MNQQTFQLSSATVDYFFDADFKNLNQIIGSQKAILLTDEHVFNAHRAKFNNWPCIVIPAGEQHKQQATIDNIIKQLIALEADRSSILVGVGGGVVTDMAGYAASIYMRGVNCAYVPTSLLNLVDASIGGKTGVDVGLLKNIVGSFKQPKFIFQDLSLLGTLPEEEWINGFAEIIKHACIKDEGLFVHLQESNLNTFRNDKNLLAKLIAKNVFQKFAIVQQDEFEKAERKLLNFGHTIGHAIENLHNISHGQAVAIGMCMAAYISEKENGFQESNRLKNLIQQYQLPTSISFNAEKVFELMKMDKKRDGDSISFILLDKIGQANIQSIALTKLKQHLEALETMNHAGNS